MKHYNRAGLRRSAPPHTEPIYLPAGSGKFVHSHNTHHHYIPVIYTLALLPGLFSSSAFSTIPNQIQDLGSLDPNPYYSASSNASAVSGDGYVIGGTSSAEVSSTGYAYNAAVIWTGTNHASAIILPSLQTNGSPPSGEVRALSTDGRLAGGWARDNDFNSRPVIWSGSNWTTVKDLGTPKSDNSGYGSVYTMSADGSVAAGMALTDMDRDYKAVVWSGTDRSTITVLGTLQSDNGGMSSVTTLSDDGLVAAGQADNGTDSIRQAVVWSGPGWLVKTPLPSYVNPNGGSVVKALSRTGSVAGGSASAADGTTAATLWLLSLSDREAQPTMVRLPSLAGPDIGWGEVSDLSADGGIAAGTSLDANNAQRAVIWSGVNWSVMTELPGLMNVTNQSPIVNQMSEDGQVIVGRSVSGSPGGALHAVLWKVTYPGILPVLLPFKKRAVIILSLR